MDIKDKAKDLKISDYENQEDVNVKGRKSLIKNPIPQRPVNLEEIGEIKNKFTDGQLDKLVEMSTYNYKSDTITLGKYIDKGQSYVDTAIKNESTYFNTGDAITDTEMTKSEIWKLNEKVLDNALAAGKKLNFRINLMII